MASNIKAVEVQQKVPAKSEAKEPTERTDDPVRMYLREMGSVETPRKRAAHSRARTPALLKGLIFGPSGTAMTPSRM